MSSHKNHQRLQEKLSVLREAQKTFPVQAIPDESYHSNRFGANNTLQLDDFSLKLRDVEARGACFPISYLLSSPKYSHLRNNNNIKGSLRPEDIMRFKQSITDFILRDHETFKIALKLYNSNPTIDYDPKKHPEIMKSVAEDGMFQVINNEGFSSTVAVSSKKTAQKGAST